MDTTQLKTDLADDLREIQSYDTSAGGYLERCVLEAAHWLTEDKDWNFMLEQATLNTTQGTKGPYTLPADFDGFPVERRITKYYAYDAANVDPPVADGSYNRRYEIYIDRSSGTPLLYFWLDPGNGGRTLTYRKTLSAYSDLTAWPEDIEVKAALKKYASFLACLNSPELQGMGANFKAVAEEKKDSLWKNFRKRNTRTDNRTAQDVFGQGLYQNYAGEYL